jgi:hypothetical protein
MSLPGTLGCCNGVSGQRIINDGNETVGKLSQFGALR